MKTKFLNHLAMLAFAAVLSVAANAALAQSQTDLKASEDPAEVHVREQRMAATVTNPGVTPQAPVAKEAAAQGIDVTAVGFDANVLNQKPRPASGKVADEYADSKAWLAEFTRWYNGLNDPYLYLSKQQVDWFSTGDWERVYQDLKHTK